MRRLGMTKDNFRASLPLGDGSPGPKSQTRRKIKIKALAHPRFCGRATAEIAGGRRDCKDGDWLWCEDEYPDEGTIVHNPRYAVGETVALTLPWQRRESAEGVWVWDAVSGRARRREDDPAISLVWQPMADPGWRRHAGYVMPVWAATHVATIIKVRAERLGEISDDDCLAEGIYPGGWDIYDALWYYPGQPPGPGASCAQEAYAAEWEALHGEGSWNPDEWVWVYDYGDVREVHHGYYSAK